MPSRYGVFERPPLWLHSVFILGFLLGSRLDSLKEGSHASGSEYKGLPLALTGD